MGTNESDLLTLIASKTQSDLIPHAQSRLIAGQMDEIRRQVGVRYPVD